MGKLLSVARLLALLGLLAACTRPAGTDPLLPATLFAAPSASPSPFGLAPTPAGTPEGEATPPAAPDATQAATEPAPALTATAVLTVPASVRRPVYDLVALVDAANHTLAVTATVALDAPAADELVFNLNAVQAGTALELGPASVAVAGGPATAAAARLEGAWLHLPLPPAVQAGTPVTATLQYRLPLPLVDPLAVGWHGTLGYTAQQINLGDWYPVLAVHQPGAGWLTPAPAFLGEYHTTPLADITVRLAVQGYAGAPLVAGSGRGALCPEGHCFQLEGGRYAAYVISDRMQGQTVTTPGGRQVTSVYFPEEAAAGEAGLQTAAAALDLYSQLYGDDVFPFFTLIEGDFYDGMEYSGSAFVGRSYYQQYDGTPNNLLTLITAHEVAHQWWHTRVGNDPAAEPWLDEALATYSELLFLEATHPESTDWWWAFRVDTYAPGGAVDQPLYAFPDFRTYVDAVYLRGAQMLHAMRQSLGDERFMQFLRDYAAGQGGGIATGADFWAAYTAAGGDAAAIKAAYFGGP